MHNMQNTNGMLLKSYRPRTPYRKANTEVQKRRKKNKTQQPRDAGQLLEVREDAQDGDRAHG